MWKWWLWPVTFFIGTAVLFAAGAIWSAAAADSALDIPIHDTYYVIGYDHWYWTLALLMTVFGIIYWFFQEVLKRPLHRALGIFHFGCTLPLVLWLASFPLNMLFLSGAPHRYYEYSEFSAFDNAWMTFSTLLVAVLLLAALGQVVFLFNVIRSLLRQRDNG